MIRILIVDDHHVVSTAFQGLLGNQPGFIVVGTVGVAADALDWVRRDAPQIVLMDLRLPGMDGIEAARRIRALNPAVHCIGLTAADEPVVVRSFFAAGGRGYLTKASRPSEVFTAIRRVAAGGAYVEQALSQRMTIAQLGGAGGGSPFDLLSGRQHAVITIDLTGTEKNDALIGARLGISPKTVSTLRHRAYRKLGVASRGEVFQLARRWGLLGSTGDGGTAPTGEISADPDPDADPEAEVPAEEEL